MQTWAFIYKNSTWDLIPPSRKKKLKKDFPKMAEDLYNVHKKHYAAVKHLLQFLKQFPVHIKQIKRHELHTKDFKNTHLVITAGGDGTFLYASHFLEEIPILGINSEPNSSVGHFCTVAFPEGKEKLAFLLSKFLEKKPVLKPLYRLQIHLNGKAIAYPVLNDILVAEENPAATSRFLLKLNNKEYNYKCSGVWIATAWGSSAAFSSAGGKKFSETNQKGEKQFGVLIREPYEKIPKQEKMRFVVETQNLEIISKMIKGRIYLDGMHRQLPFVIGDTLSISIYKKPLWRLGK
ncbi:MAG: hypothetical protein D6767_05835 [Candidatus Hydrogenedentota bacterium]|nr:MAG: hypothetical protein D6767_05835 [Candidatus Hydrogenedentota bacterium]